MLSRRLFLTALLIGFGLASTGAAGRGPQHAPDTAWVSAGALNVRAGPGPAFPRRGVLVRGERVAVTGTARGWYRIHTYGHGLSGWVSGHHLRFEPPRRRGYGHGPRHQRRVAFITPNRFGFAGMFDGPGRRHHLLARLAPGERVRIIDRGRRWTLVQLRGIGRGYVRTRLLVGWHARR